MSHHRTARTEICFWLRQDIQWGVASLQRRWCNDDGCGCGLDQFGDLGRDRMSALMTSGTRGEAAVGEHVVDRTDPRLPAGERPRDIDWQTLGTSYSKSFLIGVGRHQRLRPCGVANERAVTPDHLAHFSCWRFFLEGGHVDTCGGSSRRPGRLRFFALRPSAEPAAAPLTVGLHGRGGPVRGFLPLRGEPSPGLPSRH